MPKARTRFVCQQCGQEASRWLGRCPGCGDWNSLVEEVVAKPPDVPSVRSRQSFPQAISNIDSGDEERLVTNITEFDRVLGGGIVRGSLVLIGGDPGIGKSTLLLQAAEKVAQTAGKVLYASGEESARQISLRAKRLGVASADLLIVAETDVATIIEHINSIKPVLTIVDSIQAVSLDDLQSTPGSVAQVRESATRLNRVAKETGIPILLVGHVNKQGSIAGPKVLEHAVDAVLYFEGERHAAYRILRAAKNRFGSTEEIGVFAMQADGLHEVDNPSRLFLAERPVGAPGSVVVASMEGTRPVLVEVQALVSPTPFGGSPRRQVSGVDYNRVSIVLAVLEKRLGMRLATQDVFINVAGGLTVDEPAVDLGVALAVGSSVRGIPIDPADVVFGEVGLAGEVRTASLSEQRWREAAKLGFARCILAAGQAKQRKAGTIELVGVTSVAQALSVGLKAKSVEGEVLIERAGRSANG